MRRWQKWGRSLSRASGCLLLLISFLGAYFWFHRLAPYRRLADPAWVHAHSLEAQRTEALKLLDRHGWPCGHSGVTLEWGGKSVVQWLFDRMKPGDDLGCLGSDFCHAALELRYMTNQDYGNNAEDWIEWWQKHKDLSQEQWILQGLKTHNIDVKHPPLGQAEVTSLLAGIGRMGTNGTYLLPPHVRFNAYRWLRDSGFNAVRFAVSTNTSKRAYEAVERGLLDYDGFDRTYSSSPATGALRLAGASEAPHAVVGVWWARPENLRIVSPLICACGLLGAALVCLSSPTKRPE